MNTEVLVQLALDTLLCNQKDLAMRLGVSPTQISKWKKGEHMSKEMEENLRAMIKIGDHDPDLIRMCGSLENSIKWEKLIQYIAEQAHFAAETGYTTEPLDDEMGMLCWQTFHVLEEMGVNLPKSFPKELNIDYENYLNNEEDENGDDPIWELVYANPYCKLIHEIYISLNNVYGFYTAYVSDLIDDDELDLFDTPACNIEPCLMSLAACKLENKPELATNFKKFKFQTQQDYREWINIVKKKAIRTRVPLRAELLNLVYESSNSLGHEAEAESLGFNSSRLHPDIYMEEILVGIRKIHQMLPEIMKKLAIYDDFKLDETELRLN